jgi:hypothetical protein
MKTKFNLRAGHSFFNNETKGSLMMAQNMFIKKQSAEAQLGYCR